MESKNEQTDINPYTLEWLAKNYKLDISKVKVSGFNLSNDFTITFHTLKDAQEFKSFMDSTPNSIQIWEFKNSIEFNKYQKQVLISSVGKKRPAPIKHDSLELKPNYSLSSISAFETTTFPAEDFILNSDANFCKILNKWIGDDSGFLHYWIEAFKIAYSNALHLNESSCNYTTGFSRVSSNVDSSKNKLDVFFMVLFSNHYIEKLEDILSNLKSFEGLKKNKQVTQFCYFFDKIKNQPNNSNKYFSEYKTLLCDARIYQGENPYEKTNIAPKQ